MPNSCDNFRENLALLIPAKTGANSGVLLDGAADDATRAQLEAHVASCSSCAREVAFLRAAVGEVQNLPNVAAPPALRANVRAQIESEVARKNHHSSWTNFLRRPSRAVWAGGSFALAAFTLFLLRADMTAPLSSRSPGADSPNSALRETAPGFKNSSPPLPNSSDATAGQNGARSAKPFAPRSAQKSQSAKAPFQNTRPRSSPGTQPRVFVPRALPDNGLAPQKSTPSFKPDFLPAPESPNLPVARSPQAAPPIASQRNTSLTPAISAAAPARSATGASSTLAKSVEPSRFARLEILPRTELRNEAQRDEKVRENENAAGAVHNEKNDDMRGGAGTFGTFAAPRTDVTVAAPSVAADSVSPNPVAPSPKMAPKAIPETAAENAQRSQVEAAGSMNNNAPATPPASGARPNQILRDQATHAAPPGMMGPSGPQGEIGESARKRDTDSQRRAGLPAPRATVTPSILHRSGATNGVAGYSKIESEKTRARLTIAMPRAVSRGQIRVTLAPGLRFSSGEVSRIVWRGAARRDQVIQIELELLGKINGKEMQIALEAGDGTKIRAMSVKVAR